MTTKPPPKRAPTRHTSSAKKSATGSSRAVPGGGPPPRVSIRMYCHGLGDCLLLRFAKDDGSGTFNVLIDCGLITVAEQPKATMERVARDIQDACGGRLDVVVMTHEHWDHASGFSPAQARAIFDEMEIAEAWYAWTEDPTNALGRRLRKEREDKVAALGMAVSALHTIGARTALDRAAGVGSLLHFFGEDLSTAPHAGAKIGKTREAFDYFKHRAGVRVRYLHPGRPPIPIKGVSSTRVFALGPPEDEGLLKRSRPTKRGQEVYELARTVDLGASLIPAFARLAGQPASLDDSPFEAGHACAIPGGPPASLVLQALQQATWEDPKLAWRRIEHDWTRSAEQLALDLDNHTNNTCLVLAFEMTDTADVLLFAADAQVGNWLSWQDCRWSTRVASTSQEVITGPDLLARTVFYKVGHHGSHNATLRDLGLEQMQHEGLTAFVPVVEEHARKNRWNAMPFPPLMQRLGEKTGGRMLRSDAPIPDQHALAELDAIARQEFVRRVREGEVDGQRLYLEWSY